MKLMDNMDTSIIKNLFTTKPTPVDNVCDSKPVRHEKETYKQYGFRVAGLSQGGIHTLLPCLQSVYFGIRKEQQDDTLLQDQLIKELEANKANLEAELKNKKDEIQDTQEKIKGLKEEKEEQKKELSELKDGKKKRNRNTWITFVISSVLLLPFSIYFFIFYSSVGYSAFFKQFGIGDIENGNFNLSQAIFDSQAIPNAWNDGLAELMFILFMPFIFLALGFVLNMWERKEGWLKYVRIPFLIAVAFVFDSLLSYEICKKIYDLNAMMQLGDIPPYNIPLAFKDPTFWIIICLGFVSYLIWGIVFGIWVKSWENLESNTEKCKLIEKKIIEIENNLNKERQTYQQLNTEATGIEAKINKIESQKHSGVRYDIGKIKLELNNFLAGWQTYLTGLGKTDADKQAVNDVFNNFVKTIEGQ